MLIEQLQKQSGLRKGQLLHLAETASKRYKVYRVPKKKGGEREIAQPSRSLKAVQRWLNKVIFSQAPVHDTATAYKKGASIRNNAVRHAESSFTLRLDFEDFFPSFRYEGIYDFLSEGSKKRYWNLSDEDIRFICSVTTRYRKLTIGAPSSPYITNAAMYEFDRQCCDLAEAKGVIFTRYADDLFFSSRCPNELSDLESAVGKIAHGYRFAKLRLNYDKSAFMSKRYRRSITGLVITSDNKLSLGRKKKREIKSLIYRSIFEELPRDKCSYLQGLLAFAMDADPEFVASLSEKYGSDIVRSLSGN